MFCYKKITIKHTKRSKQESPQNGRSNVPSKHDNSANEFDPFSTIEKYKF